MRISIIGPPSSGKGTIAEQLAKKYKLFHLSPGEILREEVSKETVIGAQIKKFTDKGNLVPDQFVVELLKLELIGKKKYILDGFPRTLGQAKASKDIPLELVLSLQVPEKAVLERFSGRRICEENGHSYHLQYLPPQKAGVCDIDGSLLIHRKDDNPKVIHKRYREYHKSSQLVLAYYKRKGILRIIDANQTPKKVYEEVLKMMP